MPKAILMCRTRYCLRGLVDHVSSNTYLKIAVTVQNPSVLRTVTVILRLGSHFLNSYNSSAIEKKH